MKLYLVQSSADGDNWDNVCLCFTEDLAMQIITNPPRYSNRTYKFREVDSLEILQMIAPEIERDVEQPIRNDEIKYYVQRFDNSWIDIGTDLTFEEAKALVDTKYRYRIRPLDVMPKSML